LKRPTCIFYVPDNATMLMNTEDTGGNSARKSNKIAEASAAATPSMNINEKEQADAKKYKKKSMNLTDMSEGGKGAHKSNDITATPMRMTVTPNEKQQCERKQVAPKKMRTAMKKGLEDYFGKGKRAPVPSMEGNPISAVVQRHTKHGDTQQGMGGDGDGSFCAKPDGHGVSDNNKWSTPNTKKGNKSRWSASNDDGQNKKAKSNDDDSEGEESTQQKQGSKETAEQGDFVVDLESMGALLKKKSLRDKAAKKKAAKKKQEESVEKTTKRKKATFAPDSDNAGVEKDKEEAAVKEVAVCFKCVGGFAIRVDKGNNAKGGFDKKITEGLSFLCKYLDKAACILPSGKDQRLNPIKTKADLPKYQVTMRNYFNIPNPMAFLNMIQEGSRVIKGSAVMGFSLDPKECLDDAAGDLRMMGCSLL
jgi:hypothetical protein